MKTYTPTQADIRRIVREDNLFYWDNGKFKLFARKARPNPIFEDWTEEEGVLLEVWRIDQDPIRSRPLARVEMPTGYPPALRRAARWARAMLATGEVPEGW